MSTVPSFREPEHTKAYSSDAPSLWKKHCSSITSKRENGFSLLEMVVAMGILIVLVIGGILFYRGMNQNSKDAAVAQAAKSVYTGAVANQSDNDGSTTAKSAAEEYNSSQKEKITVDGEERSMIHTTVEEFPDGGLKVTAVYGDDEAEHIIDTSKGGDPNNPGTPGGENPITNKVSTFTYRCDVDTTGRLPIANISNGTTITVTGTDGSSSQLAWQSASALNVYNGHGSNSWPDNNQLKSYSQMHIMNNLYGSNDYPSYSTTNVVDAVTFKAGVNYDVVVDGEFKSLDSYGTESERWKYAVPQMTDCLVELKSLGDGVERIGQFVGANTVSIPSSIPSSVRYLDAAFAHVPRSFNSIATWDTGNVESMVYTFANPDRSWYPANEHSNAFNVDISNWDVSKVKRMDHMFALTTGFNQPIGKWTTSSLESMHYMFSKNETFNQPLADWDTSKVTTMRGAFTRATAFDQDLSGWDVSKVNNMSTMFAGAGSFSQDLSAWKVPLIDSAPYPFAEGTQISGSPQWGAQ
jgi:surface protein